jgi:hypothetical protein
MEHEWENVRSDRPRLLLLRKPNFAISERLTRTLGNWDARSRTITLSHQLLEGRRWHLLIETLHHEIAHQIVSELFLEADELPHGPAFRMACHLLGISPTATTRPDELDRPREEPRVVRTIRRLLALSGSPNQNEAEAALAKAQELALKYNVALRERAEPRQFEYRLLDRPRKRWPRYIWTILAICEELHDVRHIRWSTEAGVSVVELTGTSENLDLAEYTYHYLLHTGDLEWRRFRDEHRLSSDRKRLTFLLSMYNAFFEKLWSQRQVLAQSHALLSIDDPELERYYRTRHPRVRHSSSSGMRWYDDADDAGHKVGRDLRIKPGLRDAPETVKLLKE